MNSSRWYSNIVGWELRTENPLWGGNRPWGQNQQMTLEPVPTSGRSKVTATIVITVNFEFQLCVPKEETFLFPGVHWCYRVNTYWSGCVTRKEDWRLLECRLEQKFVRFLDRIFKVHSIERKKPSTRIHVVRKENDKNSHDDQTQIMVCKYRRELVTPLRIEKNKNWQQRNWSSTMLEKWKEFTLLIQMSGNLRKFCKKRKKKTGKAQHQIARRICLRSPKLHPRRIPKQCMSV